MEFDKYADNYDAGFMGKGSGRFYADLIKEIEVKDGDAVLDVGCGTGTVLSYIGRQKKIRGFGLDVSEKMVAIAKEKNPDYEFVSGDCASFPYADESMDVVMACIASCIISRGEETFDSEEGWALMKEWGVPDNYICQGFVVLGYIDGEQPVSKPRKPGRVQIIE